MPIDDDIRALVLKSLEEVSNRICESKERERERFFHESQLQKERDRLMNEIARLERQIWDKKYEIL
ncbi:MAG: hypothetical protein V1743_02285 [Nanoarchaeota archaeon]